MNQYFQLFSCCIPVKGYKKAVICDLQRNIIQPIPLYLYEILVSDYNVKTNSFDYISKNYTEKEKQTLKEYVTFLYNNQFGYTSEKPLPPIRLDLNNYEESRSITNAIVDFDPDSKHSLFQIVKQLNELYCFALEIRYFFSVTYKRILNDLLSIQQTTLKDIEVLLEYSEDYTLENVLKIKETYPAIKKLIISKAKENIVYNQEDFLIIYTTQKVIDERSCGVTNELYCIAETQLFIESIQYNSCLNKKISVDKNGLIKNCPSMNDSFGNISTVKLKDVVQKESFRRIWKINKDKIEVCSDCELRYVCQDCRAYIEDKNRIYSKPVKCNYDPYE